MHHFLRFSCFAAATSSGILIFPLSFRLPHPHPSTRKMKAEGDKRWETHMGKTDSFSTSANDSYSPFVIEVCPNSSSMTALAAESLQNYFLKCFTSIYEFPSTILLCSHPASSRRFYLFILAVHVITTSPNPTRISFKRTFFFFGLKLLKELVTGLGPVASFQISLPAGLWHV